MRGIADYQYLYGGDIFVFFFNPFFEHAFFIYCTRQFFFESDDERWFPLGVLLLTLVLFIFIVFGSVFFWRDRCCWCLFLLDFLDVGARFVVGNRLC